MGGYNKAIIYQIHLRKPEKQITLILHEYNWKLTIKIQTNLKKNSTTKFKFCCHLLETESWIANILTFLVHFNVSATWTNIYSRSLQNQNGVCYHSQSQRDVGGISYHPFTPQNFRRSANRTSWFTGTGSPMFWCLCTFTHQTETKLLSALALASLKMCQRPFGGRQALVHYWWLSLQQSPPDAST